MRVAAQTFVFAGLAVVLAACSETSNTGPASEDFSMAPAVVGTCDVVRDLTRDVRSWFSQPEQRDMSAIARDLDSACAAGMQAATASSAWQIMGAMEAVIADGRGGDPAVGSNLANELLACTLSLCMSSALPGIDFTGSLTGAGLFAIRSGGMEPALASAVVPFTDEEGNPNTAFWGVSVDQSWADVTGANPVLVYGSPANSGTVLQELNVGGLRYQLDVFPDQGEFPDGALHVGVCFAAEFELPLVAGADPGALMQRNGVVLENYPPTFCPPPSVTAASVLAPFAALARSVVPARLSSLVFGTRVGVIGGTPLDFSTFAPVAANTAGTLEFVTEPNQVVVVGQSIGLIRVRARSGNGTPMEKVKVTLSILNNNGTPAGAELGGDLESITAERNGEEGIAAFPDNGAQAVTVGKAGGYRICANGQLNGFTFAQVCSAVFNARNAN